MMFSSSSSVPLSKCKLLADRACHVVSVTEPYGRNLGFLDLVAPRIEPGPLDLWSGTLTTRPQGRSFTYSIHILNTGQQWDYT
jgi:hypothetical protein